MPVGATRCLVGTYDAPVSATESSDATPTAPIEIAGGAGAATARLDDRRVEISDEVLRALTAVCPDVLVDVADRVEASRDWWPLAMIWATEGRVGAIASVIARPRDTDEVAAVMRLCHEHRIPVTPAGGRSSVVGGVVPLHGGILLDLTAMSGIIDVDAESGVVEVLAGTFGDRLETQLAERHGLTVGHHPQSMALSTVGGWLACRGAGQLSNRYGKIEDIVVGLEVVLPDGQLLTTGGQPRQAVGPDLTQLFVGAEGTLGVITRARLRAWPRPRHSVRGAWGFDSFAEGLDAMRRIIRRGARTAVLRLYDGIESQRNFEVDDTVNVLLAFDEGDPTIVDAEFDVVEQECADADRLDDALVERWFGHRNDVAALEALISRGFVVDTMEVSSPWSSMVAVDEAARGAIAAVPGTLAVSVHQSHSYPDGGCLYFTFAGGVDPDDRERYYEEVWDMGTRAVLAAGGSLSHHHGIGLNRARFVPDALGDGFAVLSAVKAALDPHGISNPGKLGLPDPFASDEGASSPFALP